MTWVIYSRDETFSENLKLQLYIFSSQVNLESVVKIFKTESELLLDQPRLDLLFIDVQFNKLNTFSLLKKCIEQFPHAQIVLITDKENIDFNLFNIYHFWFIEKPLRYIQIQQTLNHILQYLYKNTLMLFEGKNYCELIYIDEIIYIEACGRKTIIHTSKNDISYSKSISELESILPARLFYRIHRSYIVNFHMLHPLQGDI